MISIHENIHITPTTLPKKIGDKVNQIEHEQKKPPKKKPQTELDKKEKHDVENTIDERI